MFHVSKDDRGEIKNALDKKKLITLEIMKRHHCHVIDEYTVILGIKKYS